MRVAFISQWWSASFGGVLGNYVEAIFRIADQGLIVAGPELDIRTNAPIGGAKWWRRTRDPGGGRPVVRYPAFPGQTESGFARAAMYSSFGASSGAMSGRALRLADLCFVYGSPITNALPALRANLRHGTPYILCVQDIWPDAVLSSGLVTSSGVKRFIGGSLDRFTNTVYRRARHIIAITEGMRGLLLERGVPEEKVTVIRNWPTADSVALTPRTRGVNEPLHIMYSGNLGPNQDLGTLVEALAALPDADFRLTFVGGGAAEEQLKHRVGALGLDNVRFQGAVPPADLARLQKDADVHVVALADRPSLRITVPGKFSELLGKGLPVLAICAGETAELVNASSCGVVVAPGRAEALASAISSLREAEGEWFARAGASGRAFSRRYLSREAAHRRLAAVLNDGQDSASPTIVANPGCPEALASRTSFGRTHLS